MVNRVIIGAQWGDEGKGRITDLLAQDADLIIRYQGGSNAGHTVIRDEDQFELHLIPAGILYPEKESLIGCGVMLDPLLLIKEMDSLLERGIDLKGLKISAQAHLILPYHPLLDRLQEEGLTAQIGTTKRGIGPGYVDKVARQGIRLNHLYHPKEFRSLLKENLTRVQALLSSFYRYEEELSFESIFQEYMECAERLKPHLVENMPLFIANRVKDGKKILLEGAQGCLLDLDHGTYPYVTSSNPGIGGAFTGSGLAPTLIQEILGVVKAYQTRVGEGPFPTELLDEEGDLLREKGREYGVTTGRPRRCGWLDLPLLRHAIRVNGFTSLIITKLDVLSGLERIRVCTAYHRHGEIYREAIPDPLFLKDVKPIYQDLSSWKEPLTQVRDLASLPLEAKDFLDFIKGETRQRISLISVGAKRRQIVRG